MVEIQSHAKNLFQPECAYNADKPIWVQSVSAKKISLSGRGVKYFKYHFCDANIFHHDLNIHIGQHLYQIMYFL